MKHVRGLRFLQQLLDPLPVAQVALNKTYFARVHGRLKFVGKVAGDDIPPLIMKKPDQMRPNKSFSTCNECSLLHPFRFLHV
jgi:hypothetical protein